MQHDVGTIPIHSGTADAVSAQEAGAAPAAAENRATAGQLGGGGQPLDITTRMDMEARLGADFSSVRIHTDGSAAAATRAYDARALTTGCDILFEPGAYRPGTSSGRALLAHELAHVVQQSRSAGSAGPIASETLEDEAWRAGTTPDRASVTPGAAVAGSVQPAKKEPPPTTTTSIAPKAPEPKPPPEVEEARRLQQRASQLQEHLPSADADRTVCCGPNEDYISGTAPRQGFKHVGADEVARQAGRVSHPPAAGGYLDPTRTGEAADVHAEVKQATDEPGAPKGVSRPMCDSCRGFHQKQAMTTGKTETVADPEMVRQFRSNGEIVRWHPDGSVDITRPGSGSAAPGPERTRTSFRRGTSAPHVSAAAATAPEGPSVKAGPSAVAAETLSPVKTELVPAPPAEATTGTSVVAGGKGPTLAEGAPAAGIATRTSGPALGLGRLGGMVVQFAIWMLVDYFLRKWGDARQRATIAELTTAKIEPGITRRLAKLSDEAQRLAMENPYAIVYANVTAELEIGGMEDELGGVSEEIRDMAFSGLTISLKPEEASTETPEATTYRSFLTAQRFYRRIRTVTYPLPLEFPDLAEQLEWLRLRMTAKKLVEAGIAARGVAEATTFWSEEKTELFVQAYIELSTGGLQHDAKRYLDELRKRPPGWRNVQRRSFLQSHQLPTQTGPTIERARP